MLIKCPACNQECEIDVEPTIGWRLQCPSCGVKFSYAPQENEESAKAVTDATSDMCDNGEYDGKGRIAIARVRVGEWRDKFFPKVKASAIAVKGKITMAWKNSEGLRNAFISKTKAAAMVVNDRVATLWKSGAKGKTIICAVTLVAVYAVLPLSRKDDTDSAQDTSSVRKESASGHVSSAELGAKGRSFGDDEKSTRGSIEKIDFGDGRTANRLNRIFKLAQTSAADGDAINFYGFFSGMSRHDAQILAEIYGLDGNDCSIHSDGEKRVCAITLNTKAISHILKIMKINARTYEEIAQAVANVVGDLQSKGTRTLKGSQWGSGTYVDEYLSQWYERTLVNGTSLTLAKNGMAIREVDDARSKMPVETAEAREQRIKVMKSVIPNLLGGMVDVPVKHSDMNPFKIGKYEVTQLQWTHVMGKNPSHHMSEQIGAYNSGIRPVDNVSWNDCQDFLKELNALPEVKETGLVFRLPTAKEWEYACRAGAAEGVCKLSDGREVSKTRIDDVAWIHVTDGLVKPVGLKAPNAFGLFDMIGNVSEWTASWDDKYKDRCFSIGGNYLSKWDEDSAKRFWREAASPKYGNSINLGFRLCASKSKDEKSTEGMRRFGETFKICSHTWTFDVIDGEATITGVSPKTGDIDIPAKVGADNCTVTRIGNRALSDCREMFHVTIPDSVKEIGKNAFCRCHNLKDLTIPDSVKNIDEKAFDYCRSLTNVRIGTSVTNIGEQAFGACNSLTSVTIPDSVVALDANAFWSCKRLTDVTIGNGVTSIGRGAFKSFNLLTSVSIGNGVTNIGEEAFNNCRKLVNLKLGKNVTSIGKKAFELCESLSSIKLPDSVTSIEDGAFASCRGIINMKIPDSVVSIGENAFANCSGLTSLKIGKRVKTIGAAAFSGCSGLTMVDIPDSVEVIGGGGPNDGAFSRCGLISVTIGKGVKVIGSHAFWACRGLTSVVIPDSVTTVGEGAFSQCGLKSVTIGKGVTNIGKDVFNSCRNLTNVTIPDNVEHIEEGAFASCASLTSVTIGNGVTHIGEYAFRNCGALTSVNFGKSVSIIGAEAFCGCERLERVTLPDSVESIGTEAFSRCRALTSVTIPESVAGIGSDAFQWCNNLKDVKAPKRFLPLNTK